MDVTHEKLIELVYGYVYLTDFKDDVEMETVFEQIEETSHPDAQYMVLVKDGEIAREYPDR